MAFVYVAVAIAASVLAPNRLWLAPNGVCPMRAVQSYIIFSLLPILSRFAMEQNVQICVFIFPRKPVFGFRLSLKLKLISVLI